MQDLHIEKTLYTPKIILDYTNGLIEFEGKSYPEDSFTFYTPILTWLEEYFTNKPNKKTFINIKLEYFNSSSSQVLFNIFDIINNATYDDLELNWCYREEDEESYEDYEDICEEFPELTINAVIYKVVD